MSQSASPYSDLPPSAFWRSGVAELPPLDPGALYTPRVKLRRSDKVFTAGSCFAQHVGRRLSQAGLHVLDMEPAPFSLSLETAQAHGMSMFSARFGNIYTVRQMVQLVDEAYGRTTPAHPVWEREGRFYDAQRPAVEPGGFDSPDSVLRHRAAHLEQVRKGLESTDVFIFTLGLTECWRDLETGTVYPTAPGVVCGRFDPEVFGFHNLTFSETRADVEALLKRLTGINPAIRVFLTVSPVPLTATASGQHVAVATAQSKAILRAVCADVLLSWSKVDYVPSYEVITSQKSRGIYFEPNMRNVSPQGVDAAMKVFLSAQGVKGSGKKSQADVQCEDALLDR